MSDQPSSGIPGPGAHRAWRSEVGMSYSIDEWMVGWNPGSGEVEIGPWPDATRWSDCYQMTSGCCYSARHALSADGKAMMLFIDFHTLVVRDGVSPQDAHRQFLKID